MTDLREEVVALLRKSIKEIAIDGAMLEVPPERSLGDFAFPCFLLAKEMKQAPPVIAEGLANTLVPSGIISKIENKGPYLNFYLDDIQVAKLVLADVVNKKELYGAGDEGEIVVIEHTAPNTNKPLHIGHLRNMLLGNSVSTILDFAGNKAFQVNVNNDRGIHICKSVLAYKKFGNEETPESTGIKPDHFVGKYYVRFAEKLKENPSLEDEAHEMLKLLEAGDKETVALWKKMNSWAFKGMLQTFKRVGISFTKEYYESEYYDKGKDIIQDALKKGIFEKDDDGNILVDLEKDKLGKKVVLRADGTAVYATQDMQLARLRNDDFKPDRLVYVVGSEQDYYFKQLFKIFEKLSFPFADKCYHLSYGMVSLPEGRMKSREGTNADADDLLDEVIAIAKSEITLRHKGLTPVEVTERAKMIGLGAIKFHFLKNDPSGSMMFDPKESVSFEGETGPYVQYAHARACAILRKYGKKVSADVDESKLFTPEEASLVRALNEFKAKVSDAAKYYKPSVIAHYLIELSQLFNEFYHQRHVTGDNVDEETSKARLLLVDCVRQVLVNGLKLLGIAAPEEM